MGSVHGNDNQYVQFMPSDFVVNTMGATNRITENMPNHVESQYIKIIGNETVIKAGFAERCESILVLTGVIRVDYLLLFYYKIYIFKLIYLKPLLLII